MSDTQVIAHEREVFQDIQDHIAAAVDLAEQLWDRAYAADYVAGTARRLFGAPDSPAKLPVDVPHSVRWEVWLRDDFRCQDCGRRTNLTVDHIVPRVFGGLAVLGNLQTLCGPCNSRKGSR